MQLTIKQEHDLTVAFCQGVSAKAEAHCPIKLESNATSKTMIRIDKHNAARRKTWFAGRACRKVMV